IAVSIGGITKSGEGGPKRGYGGDGICIGWRRGGGGEKKNSPEWGVREGGGGGVRRNRGRAGYDCGLHGAGGVEAKFGYTLHRKRTVYPEARTELRFKQPARKPRAIRVELNKFGGCTQAREHQIDRGPTGAVDSDPFACCIETNFKANDRRIFQL